MAEQHNSDYLRELIRLLVRNLGILEKNDAACCGATLGQCHAIVEIGRVKKLSLNDLAQKLMLDKSTTSRTINSLVSAKLVGRELHQADRRFVTLELTEEGRTVFDTIESGMADYFKRIFASIPEGEREQVIQSITLLTDAVKENRCC